MISVTMLNQKGGVGKTSTTHHLAGTLAKMGKRVLLVDNDPQSSLSQGLFGPSLALGLDPLGTIFSVHRGDEPYPESVIRPTGIPGVDIVPGSESATSFNLPDPHLLHEDRQRNLKSFLAECSGYDYCLIDCPPNLHLCSWSALVASHGLVVPMQPEDYGAQGIAAVQRSIAMVQSHANPSLILYGFLLTMVSANRAMHKEFERMLRESYGELIFSAKVPENPAFVEAIAARQTIAHFKPSSAGAKAIHALALEFMGRVQSVTPAVEEAA